MIHPSYVDLMEVVNKGVEEGETPVINSRYSIVMATAKRARQIVNGDDVLIDAEEGEKPLSIAVEELNQEKIRILAEDEPDEEVVLTESDLIVDDFADAESAEISGEVIGESAEDVIEAADAAEAAEAVEAVEEAAAAVEAAEAAADSAGDGELQD